MESSTSDEFFRVCASFLESGQDSQEQHEIPVTPIFTQSVFDNSQESFTQYGLLGGISDRLGLTTATYTGSASLFGFILTPFTKKTAKIRNDPVPTGDSSLFFNIAAPSSAFICGSQGSGKSHTLSCLLENCLVKSEVNKLENPLAGLVFHYDTFSSDFEGSPCEAAHLASNTNIKVRVFCSPANIATIRRTYSGLNVEVEALEIGQNNLNTTRMLDLMAVNRDDPMPLYLHSVTRILRELRIVQQETSGAFNYADFKRRIMDVGLTPMQLGPLQQRLDTLESFMPSSQTLWSQDGLNTFTDGSATGGSATGRGNNWKVQPGSLIIIDLSCPCVTAESACGLFNICLGIFLEQQTNIGRVIALDEAHKYMNAGPEAASLTNTLLSSIRLQRHLGTRVFISTQEPTVSTKLLDLCSITVVHRFTSPEWLRCLKSHLAALGRAEVDDSSQNKILKSTFNRIVSLRTGEALLFAPSAIIGTKIGKEGEAGMEKLGSKYLKIKVRGRITNDGGKSVMAGVESVPLPTTSPTLVSAKSPQLTPAGQIYSDLSSPVSSAASNDITHQASGSADNANIPSSHSAIHSPVTVVTSNPGEMPKHHTPSKSIQLPAYRDTSLSPFPSPPTVPTRPATVIEQYATMPKKFQSSPKRSAYPSPPKTSTTPSTPSPGSDGPAKLPSAKSAINQGSTGPSILRPTPAPAQAGAPAAESTLSKGARKRRRIAAAKEAARLKTEQDRAKGNTAELPAMSKRALKRQKNAAPEAKKKTAQTQAQPQHTGVVSRGGSKKVKVKASEGKIPATTTGAKASSSQ